MAVETFGGRAKMEEVINGDVSLEDEPCLQLLSMVFFLHPGYQGVSHFAPHALPS